MRDHHPDITTIPRIARATAVILTLSLSACRPATRPTRPVTVEQAWRRQTVADSAGVASSTRGRSAATGGVIALVDGAPIGRDRLIKLLLQSHGPGLLEQLVVLEKAEQFARQRGIRVTDADVQAEYEMTLAKILSDNDPAGSREIQRHAAEAILNEMLAERNISPREYQIVTRRNATLRKILAADLKPTDEQIQQQFARMFHERVLIRHIQVARRETLNEILRLRKQGVGFTELALRYSENPDSRRRQGMLPPFDENDPDVPELLRKKAFELAPGAESTPIYVNNWFHLIRLEQRLPAQDVSLSDVRPEVERALQQRLTEPGMQQLYKDLFQQANIEIRDPDLRRLFFEKHPDHHSALKK